MCSIVVATLGAAALHVVGIAAKASASSERRAVGSLIAAELLAEITAMPFDINGTPGPVELKGGGRETMEDIDDYHGYKVKSPTDRDGTPLEGLDNYSIDVQVEHVNPDTPSITSATPTGVMRITVRVEHSRQLVAEAVAIRTQARDDLEAD